MMLPRTIPILPFLAAAACLACARSPAPPLTTPLGPPLAGLKVQFVSADEGTAPEDCPAATGIGFALLAGLDLDPAAKTVMEVAIGCESGSPADEPGTVVVSVEVTLDQASPGHPDESYDGVGMTSCSGCEDGKARGILALTVARAVREALDLALGQARVARLPDDAVAGILTSPKRVARSVLLAALEEAGMRRLRAALEPSMGLLDSDDDDVALRAVGVLSRLQDPAALKALGKMALSKRPEVPFAALRAMADIDGPDAQRALELVAGQATDPILAREATELLNEITDGGRE
jgi:hypothetical protein